MKPEDRVVVVTGAGSGIGAALAHEAARRGARAVAVIDIEEDAARRVVQELRASGVQAKAYRCDVAIPDGVEETADEVTSDFGVPGLVCANAGVGTEAKTLLDESADILNWVLSVNVVGTWATLRAFGRRMVDVPDEGWLLVTASEHALGVPFPGNGAYTASKHAILGLADVMRAELPENVGISAVLPGLVATGLGSSALHRPERFGGPAKASEAAGMLLALGMAPDLVAGAALDGVEREQFLIATHAHAHRYSDKRSGDIDAAFTALAATDIPDDSYDVFDVLARLAEPHNRDGSN